MLGNTLTITVATVPYVLTKINQDSYASEYLYRDSVEEYTLKVRHTTTTKAGVKYDRHNVELRHKIYETTTDAEVNRMMYYVLEQEPKDPDIADALGAFALASATSGSFLTSLTKWES